MHKIWQGTDPMVNLGVLGAFLAVLALVIHVWAYSIVGWPNSKRAEYRGTAAPAAQTPR